MKIGRHSIEPGSSPIVIAELGINHFGDLETALRMADAAIRAGVQIIKHQFHIPDEEMSSEAKVFEVGYIGKSIYQLIDECSLTPDEEMKLKEHVEGQGCTYMCTPFSLRAAQLLFEMGVVAFKIGSGESNNKHFVRGVAKYKLPIVLSTGMNSVETLSESFRVLGESGIPYALMHTTNIYPTPNHLVRLGGMQELMTNFDGIPVGLSDHTRSNHASFAAVALGATIIERHFTLDKKVRGPDIENSMDEHEARELVEGVRLIWECLGGSKGPAPEESEVSAFAFQSVVTTKRLLPGHRIECDDITLRRPGSGDFRPNDIERLIGSVLKVEVAENVQLKRNHLK
jgi:sialic acid synthase SpsE